MSIGTTSAKTTRIAVIGASCILALLMELSFAQCIRAQDIPLDSCKALATIEATADRRRLRFLVDTGATSSLLNAKSFSEGDAAHVMVHSWNGAFSADGRGVGISDLMIGGHHLNAMSFLAVDLSDLERECGKEIDGIMGADLIRKLGLEIDLKRHVARFAADAKHEEKEFTDLGEQLELCRAAFDRSDMKAIGNCLDPDVVLVDSGKSYRGRDAVLKYFDHEYFADGRSTTMSIDRSTYHATGEGVWLEYELRIRFHDQAIRERGTALFQKLGRKWLVVSLNGADPREELTPR
jgi:ketosteroid isomerase-like protein